MAGRSKQKTKKPKRRIDHMVTGTICSWTTTDPKARSIKNHAILDFNISHRNPVYCVIAPAMARGLREVVLMLPQKWVVDIDMVYTDVETGEEKVAGYQLAKAGIFKELDDSITDKVNDLSLELKLMGGELKHFIFAAEIVK